MTKLFLIFGMLITGSLYAKGNLNDTIFYKSDWTITNKKSKAKFYRLITKNAKGGFTACDYYLSNHQLQMKGNYSELNEEVETKEGFFEWYDSLGQKTSEANYEDGKLTGVSKQYDTAGHVIEQQNYLDGLLEGKSWVYYANGKIQYEENYRNNKLDGIQKTYYKTGELKRNEVYKNGVWISGNCYTKKGEEAEFVAREVMASFVGGEEKLVKYIKKNLKYPKEAISRGKSGTVYVKFIVNTDGAISDITVIKSIDKALDKAAIELVESMPNWQPGYIEGKAVKVSFILPLTFSLN